MSESETGLISKFINDLCEVELPGKAPDYPYQSATSELYSAFVNWCGRRNITKISFSKILSERGFERKLAYVNGKRTRVFLGIRLIETGEKKPAFFDQPMNEALRSAYWDQNGSLKNNHLVATNVFSDQAIQAICSRSSFYPNNNPVEHVEHVEIILNSSVPYLNLLHSLTRVNDLGIWFTDSGHVAPESAGLDYRDDFREYLIPSRAISGIRIRSLTETAEPVPLSAGMTRIIGLH